MGQPMTLGQFRALTAELPDSALLFHEYDTFLVPTRAAVVARGFAWTDNDAPSAERAAQTADHAVITGASVDDVEWVAS